MRTETTQALVLGGGVAGASAAVCLARAQRSVVLIERRDGPHDKVCGEFLSAEAALYLQDMDVDLPALGAVPITDVRIYAKRETMAAPLPFPAFSLSRRVLDEALLRAAAAAGAEIRRGKSVRSLHSSGDGWIAELDDGGALGATDAFLATGKHDLRGWKRPAGAQPDLIAFKLHWRLGAQQDEALGACVEIFLFPGGYAGLEPVENGFANLCLVVRQGRFEALGRTWRAVLAAARSACPCLDERLAAAQPCWGRPLAIASIPYGHVQRRGRGPWLIGDQAAVIPSFCGDGLALALHSARLAAQYFNAGQAPAQFQHRLALDIGAQVRRATLISRLLVHPNGQAAAHAAARLLPSLVGIVARHTRVPPRCVQRLRRRPLALLPAP